MLFAYLFIGGLNIAGHFTGQQAWALPTKVLLMPLLALYVFLNQMRFRKGKWKLIFSALLASWGGDIFLEVSNDSLHLFLAGMAAFLLAHIFYLGYFFGLRSWKNGYLRKNMFIILVFSVYVILFLLFLEPHLQGILEYAVFIYAVFITIMGLSAFNSITGPISLWQFIYLIGVILFLVSDSMIAIRNFIPDLAPADASAWIMLTYILAQVAIVTGVTNANKPELTDD